VGGAGDVEGLDVEEREGLRSVKTAQHDVRTVCKAVGYPEGFRSVVVIAKVGASRDETKTQARKSSQLM
jgi:hypothetical protein